MSRELVMNDLAPRRAPFVRSTMPLAGVGEIPALVGAIGAGIGLHAMGAFLAPVSLPFSVLGLLLGIQRRSLSSLCLGAFGIVCAIIVLTQTPGLWFLLDLIGGARLN